MSRGDSSSSKVSLCIVIAVDSVNGEQAVRAMQSLSEPSCEIDRASFLDQIAKELVAAEKIRIGEWKRMGEYGRMIGERSRREGR